MKIHTHILNTFIRHAQQEAPNEACALLTGSNDEIDTLYLMTNVDKSPVHYTLHPQEQLLAVKHARKQNRKLLGVIHSHPETPARPSEEDKRLAAMPGILHLITSLAAHPPVTRAYSIEDGVSTEVPICEISSCDVSRHFSYPQGIWNEQIRFMATIAGWQHQDWQDVRKKALRVRAGIYEQREGSTYMIRARIPSGIISAHQLSTVGKAARRYGNGMIHLTTRQSLQLHHIPRHHIADVLRDLSDAQICTIDTGGNSIRNIVTCSGGGNCPHQQMDIIPVSLALGTLLMENRSTFNLPRKFKIGFSACSRDCAGTVATDLGFVAKSDSIFQIFAAGGLGSRPSLGILLHDDYKKQDISKVALAAISIFTQAGLQKKRSGTRFRHLLAKLGGQKLLELYGDALSAHENVSPLRLACPSVFDVTGTSNDYDSLSSETALTHSNVSLTVRPPLGILTGDEAITLSRLSIQFDASLRINSVQGIGIHGIQKEREGELCCLLEALWPQWSLPVLQRQPVVCAGSTVCKQGICNSRALATALQREFTTADVVLPSHWPQIRISGCPNSCAGHQIASLGLQGGARRIHGNLIPVYDFFVRQTAGANLPVSPLGTPIGTLAARRVPGFLGQLAAAMHHSGKDLCDIIKKELELYQLQHGEDCGDPLDRDLGRDEPFSLESRTRGECSLGIIDIIEADLRNARKLLDDFQTAHQPKALYDGAIFATRALLITRGEERTEVSAVVNSFSTHFIHTGLLNNQFAELVSRLASPSDFLSAFALQQIQFPLVQNFIEAIEELYRNMDNSFQFVPASRPTTTAHPEGNYAPDFLDLSGVACPMNFVKAKLALERLPVGATLQVVLDDGPPIRNVPASFRAQGQTVRSVSPIGPGRNLLSVQRAR